jgi:hypothetical protein
MRKRLMMALATGALLAAMMPGAASAFEPPADPAEKFSCPSGDPVAGHPGAGGLDRALTVSGNIGPWNPALNPATPITVC